MIRPLMTEKSMTQAQTGWFTFAVPTEVSKRDIAHEISRHYKVTVAQVRTMTRRGKVRRVGKKMLHVTKSDWKKAMVRLAAGQTIEAFGEGEKKA